MIYIALNTDANKLTKQNPRTPKIKELKTMDKLYWKDGKGREIEISTMSNKWLNNIRKSLPLSDIRRIDIVNELKRRRKKSKDERTKQKIQSMG